MEHCDGAVIERGRIKTVTETGYIVASADRDGIVTPEIGTLDGNSHAVGELVYFFLFRDGTGKIIGAA